MAPRPILSDEQERAEREDRARLRAIDAKLDALFRRRQELIAELRRISTEQKALFDQRQAPQDEVERLYEQHGVLGKKLATLRGGREAARKKVEEAVIRYRELKLTFAPGERVRPEQLRREIAELDLKQQTRALPLDEENALIDRLRQRTRELKDAEARASVVAEHERLRKEAEQSVAAARAEVERLGEALTLLKAERDATMAAVRAKLVAAGALLAELRSRSRARAEVAEKLDALGREMRELEREGRAVLGKSRARRDEARKMLRAYSRRREPSEDLLSSTAEAQLEELLKRGKITLGG